MGQALTVAPFFLFFSSLGALMDYYSYLLVVLLVSLFIATSS